MKPTARAFSLIEVLITVSVIGILAAASMVTMNRVVGNSREQKLESDASTLNRAVKAFLASGGEVGALTTPDEVLVAMKRSATSGSRTVGMAGAVIDPRIVFVMQTPEEAKSGVSRLYWNPDTLSFELSTKGNKPGIAAVAFDDGAALPPEGMGNRAQRVLYAKDGSWVWDYQDSITAPPAGPSPIVLGETPDTTPPSPPVTLPSSQIALLPPLFSIPSGSFPLADFPLKLTLTDPNPSGRGKIYFSVDYGNWLPYTGPISVPAGAVIGGQVIPETSDYSSSPRAEETYRVKRLALSIPSIELTATEFDDHLEIIGVRLTDTNAPGLATLAYALTEPGAAPPARNLWVAYNGEFSVTASQFPAGFTLHAYARAVDPAAYTDSAPVQKSAGANFTFPDSGDGRIVFVIDASGSMDTAVGNTTRFRLVQDALIGAINRLRPTSRFSVVTFAGDIVFTNGSWDYLAATVENKAMMADEINRFRTNSGTNYEAALRAPSSYSTRPDVVFFLTDGEPTGGGTYNDEVDALVAAKVPVYTIGVDLREAGRSRLSDIAAATGGTATMVSTN